MVLVLCAYAAGAAKAEKGASWMVNGKNIESESTLKPLLQSTVENEMLLLFTIAGISGKVLCKGMQFVNFRLLGEGTLSEGKIKFSECETYVEGKLTKECAPKTGGASGIIESAPGPALLGLAGGQGVIKFKPGKGEFFMVFEMGEECALGVNISIVGELVLKDCQNKMKEELVSHLLEADASSTLKVVGAAGKPATLEGSILVTLAGEHTGLKWSGLPA